MDDTGHIDRRIFLSGLAATSVPWCSSPAAGSTWFLEMGRFCCTGDHPIQCLLEHRFETLVAFVEAHLCCLWNGPSDDNPREVACDIVRYIRHLNKPFQQALCLVLTGVNLYCIRHTGKRLECLSVATRRELLNQGEQRCPRRYRLIRWDEDFLTHTSVSGLSLLTRIVANSRLRTRQMLGFRWSPQCQDPGNLVSVPAPPYPDLNAVYDVCIIGSGAGGSIVAARAAEAGKRVLIVEEGEWISPDGLVQRTRDQDGNEQIWPARDDDVLIHTYQHAAVNITEMQWNTDAGQGQADISLFSLVRNLRKAKPRQAINVLQAKVVGGGPYINNAIHIGLAEEIWQMWGEGFRPPVSFQQFQSRMKEVTDSLGVNTRATEWHSGDSSQRFVEACRVAGVEVSPLPVSILPSEPDDPNTLAVGAACGADNSIDPFGNHIGGLHEVNPDGPNSYLMRALHAAVPAAVAYETRVKELRFETADDCPGSVSCLLAEDRRGICPGDPGRRVTIRARTYVLSAGAIGSTKLLFNSLRCSRIRVRGLGQRFTANVVTPVYAVYDQPIHDERSMMTEPGIAQCYYVKSQKCKPGSGEPDEPALENWFHYPGSLAVALTGWFDEYASVMRKYQHLSLCGMVVPTKVRPQNRVGHDGKLHLNIDRDEFELLLSGVRKIGRIYLASATPENGVTIYLPTKAVLLDRCDRPVRIRSMNCLDWALDQIRCRGPEFLNLATAHPQGGNSLGTVVNPETFQVQDCCQRPIENLFVADASLCPAGCHVNPQLTVKGLTMYAADSLLRRLEMEAPLVGSQAYTDNDPVRSALAPIGNLAD